MAIHSGKMQQQQLGNEVYEKNEIQPIKPLEIRCNIQIHESHILNTSPHFQFPFTLFLNLNSTTVWVIPIGGLVVVLISHAGELPHQGKKRVRGSA